MRRASVTLLLLLVAFVSYGQATIRGGLDSHIEIQPSGVSETPLNPDNMLGLREVGLSHAANLRLEGSNEVAALDLRFDFRAYPIADVLIGAASFLNPAMVGAVADVVYTAGDAIWSADLTRASVSWFPDPAFHVSLGRQILSTGYGLGWNPADLVHPFKNPLDPDAFITGVDGLMVSVSPFWWLNSQAYVIVPGGASNWEELVLGVDTTLFTPIAELKFGGAWSDHQGYPDALAAALYVDILGFGLYGEGVLRTSSRRGFVDDNLVVQMADDRVWSALAGIEYFLPAGVPISVEYFFNGEGWNEAQRTNYRAALSVGPPSGSLLQLYIPGAYSQHYLMFAVNVPVFRLDGSIDLLAIGSLDTGSLVLGPSASFNLDAAGSLAADISYFGFLSLFDDPDDEASLAPVRRGVSVGLSYAF